MFKLRFFIAVSIYLAVSIMLPFFLKISANLYWVMIAFLTLGYLLPSVLTMKKKIGISILIWIPSAAISLVFYDYFKSLFDDSHGFFQNWEKFYSIGLLIVLGLQLYTRFISEFILKQLTKK